MIIYLRKTSMEGKIKIFFLPKIFITAILATFLSAGCASQKTLTLMPTPILYQNADIDPFAHLTEELKSTETQVFMRQTDVPYLQKIKLDMVME